jgi:hypothetical protein
MCNRVKVQPRCYDLNSEKPVKPQEDPGVSCKGVNFLFYTKLVIQTMLSEKPDCVTIFFKQMSFSPPHLPNKLLEFVQIYHIRYFFYIECNCCTYQPQTNLSNGCEVSCKNFGRLLNDQVQLGSQNFFHECPDLSCTHTACYSMVGIID